MRTVVITDGKYRFSVAAARMLARGGYEVVAVQTRGDCPLVPPLFVSKAVSEYRWLPGDPHHPAYAERLLSVLQNYRRPVLLCAGADTLNTVAWQRARFAECACFLIAPPAVLDALNNKETVHRRCEELGIPVPTQYEGEPERYPVVVKPHCGEKQGLKAAERYIIARDRREYYAAMKKMAAYDPDPLVQELVEGDGAGVSLLLGKRGNLLGAICHRRIREYPVSGGPSSCCESFYDDEMIAQAHRLLSSFGFQGLAMVEFKGPYVLEVNPRLWGSFPLTEKAESPLAVNYARSAAGEPVTYVPEDYKTGVRMRFLLSDSAAMLGYLKSGRPGPFFAGLADTFRAREALSDRRDPAPLRQYLRNTIWKR